MVLDTNLPIHSSTIRDFVAGTQYFLAELRTESVLQPVNKFTYRYMLSVFCLMILTHHITGDISFLSMKDIFSIVV